VWVYLEKEPPALHLPVPVKKVGLKKESPRKFVVVKKVEKPS
jgi:hypothetical protein